jgi:hypothetical protein
MEAGMPSFLPVSQCFSAKPAFKHLLQSHIKVENLEG